jgi:hypothetical protein
MFFSLQEPHIKIIEINYQSHSQNAQYEMVKLKKKKQKFLLKKKNAICKSLSLLVYSESKRPIRFLFFIKYISYRYVFIYLSYMSSFLTWSLIKWCLTSICLDLLCWIGFLSKFIVFNDCVILMIVIFDKIL